MLKGEERKREKSILFSGVGASTVLPRSGGADCNIDDAFEAEAVR